MDATITRPAYVATAPATCPACDAAWDDEAFDYWFFGAWAWSALTCLACGATYGEEA